MATISIDPRELDETSGVLDVLVVGGGFAGLYQLDQLRSRGFSVKVVEAGDSLGASGTGIATRVLEPTAPDRSISTHARTCGRTGVTMSSTRRGPVCATILHTSTASSICLETSSSVRG